MVIGTPAYRPTGRRVLVAMSGGVDSSGAAALLVAAGAATLAGARAR